MVFMRSIYWFKKDLRIEDNKALLGAIHNSKELIPIFIFDKNILREFNSYNEKLGFTTESIKELSKKIKIYCYYDRIENVFENLIQVLKPDAIFTAKSFSWRGESRDEKIKDMASKNNIKFFEIFDNCLADFTKIPYTRVFTPFYKKWINNIDDREYSVNLNTIKVPDIKSEDIHLLLKKHKK